MDNFTYICSMSKRALKFLEVWGHDPGFIDCGDEGLGSERIAFLMEKFHEEESRIIRDYREVARATAMAETLKLLFAETHNHVGTSPTPCIYEHQFADIVDKIDEIYNSKNVKDG